MIATPESGVDSIAISYAILDPIMTNIRPVAAFVTAVLTGIAQNFFGTESNPGIQTASNCSIEKGSDCGCSSDNGVVTPDIHGGKLYFRLGVGLKYAFGELLSDISKPFVIGIFIAGLITFFFPEDITTLANEHKLLSMLVMLIAGIPMYICATASTPIAAALILKGLNPGAALVFLLAGPATNAATINIVRNIFNNRALVIYIAMISVCAIGFGFLVDWIYVFLNLQASITMGMGSEIIPYSLKLTSAGILTVLIAYNAFIKFKQQSKHSTNNNISLL